MKRTLIKSISFCQAGDKILVKGWVRTRRDSKGGFSFIELNDGSCFSNVQIIADGDLKNYTNEILKLQPGSSVAIIGKLVESPGAGQKFEIQASDIKVYGFVDIDEYPLKKQRISFEKLREIAHLRPRTNTFGAVARVRNALALATHLFFHENDFLYVHTPIVTASDCEGAGDMFKVTTLNLDNIPKDDQGQVNFKEDFFQKPAFLTVSGQISVETYCCALSNVYTFGPTFRAENSNTSRHLAEFWMIEPEIAFADLEDDAELAEQYLKYMFKYVLEHCSEDLEFFDKRIENGLIEKLTNIVELDFIRLTYTEAISILEKTDKKFQFPVNWGCDLQSEHERYLTEIHFKAPVILTDYPKDIKAFYMKMNNDGKTVRAMDVLCPQIGEIIGGSQREDDYDVLIDRMNAQGLNSKDYWWYLDLRKFGTQPHAGFGLGFERLVQFTTGMENIRDVIPFPRVPRSAEF